MKQKEEKIQQIKGRFSQFTWLIYIQALASALWVLLIPGEAERAVFLGYSFRRLALLLPIIALVSVFFIFSLLLEKNKKIQAIFIKKKRRIVLSRWLVIGGALLSEVMMMLFTFYHYLLWFPDVGAFYRLQPLMLLFFLVGVEMILFVQYALWQTKKSKNLQISDVWRSNAVWITLLILLVVLSLIEITDLGKEPVRVSIISLGVPLLEGQVWFTAGSIALFLLAALTWPSTPDSAKKKPRKYFDLIVFIFIWLIAFAFWMQFPLPEHNYFAPAVRPPTYDKYPFSDAEQYDYNSLYVLFGALDDFIVSKPLYVSFLAILHFLVGFDYGRIVLLQTVVVAILPAVGYLIGKELHSRLAGGGLALLLILREANAILSSTMANVSNSKMLMSDVPATLIMAVVVLVTIRWCKSQGDRVSHHVFLLGGLTAVLNLTRIQTLVLIPFFLVLIIIRYFKKWKQILLAAGVFLLTVISLLAPILIRNHSITDVYWLDNPSSSSALYSFILKGSDIDIEVAEAETSEEVLDRNFSVIFTAMRENLGQMVGFILENFSRNLISTILILPLRLGNGVPFEDMLRMVSPFFQEVYSQPGFLNGMTLLLNLIVISVGFASVWRKDRLAASMVLLTYLAYNASSSAVRLSGWRFIQPVDWIMLIFFVAGLIEIIDALIRLVFLRNYVYQKPEVDIVVGVSNSLMRYILPGIAFVVFCAFIPLREGLLPDTYPPYDTQSICEEIREVVDGANADISPDEVFDYCLADTTRVYKGYGFYPRFFKKNEGYYDRSYDPFFGEQNYFRLVFRLVGGRNGKIYIKTKRAKIPFYDGDVVYTLIYDRPKADAQLVIVGENNPVLIISDPILDGVETFAGLR